MRGLGQVLKTNRKKVSFFAGLALAFVGLTGTLGLTIGQVIAVTCTDNDIIKCGFTSLSGFITQVRKNDNLVNSKQDLQAIYANYGLHTTDYDNFVAHGVLGEAHSDGRVTLADGTVVANGGKSIGRFKSSLGSNPFTVSIGGTDYYGNVNAKAFASGVEQIPVYILFDASGTMQFAVMKPCGNPEFGTAVKTSASCKVLNAAPVQGKLNSYSFTAAANTMGNAKITKYVYDFGDGSKQVTETSGTTVVPYTYTKAGTFTATVTEYASVPGNSNLKLEVISTCKKVITVKLPFDSCVSLAGAILDKSKMVANFTATADFGNGATFTSADFDFGDGNKQLGVKPTTDKTVVVNHTYATAGNYNAFATLYFSIDGKPVTAPTCKTLVTPTTVTPECKPGVPVGSPECLPPCQPGSSVPPDSPQCTSPNLPNTGAGNTIAIFGGVMIVGFLVYRQLLFRRHRAAFVAAEQGTSPLPLGDPLNIDAPLAGTPLATKKRTFRRRKF